VFSSLFKRGAAAALFAAVGLGAAAVPAVHASDTPPVPSPALFGTWVNTNAKTPSVKQIVIERNPTGAPGMLVDAFGACVPSLCEWGLVPAIVYGNNVSAKSGAAFQTDQGFVNPNSLPGKSTEWSRTQLIGQLITPIDNPLGSVVPRQVLVVRELTAFEDGSGRHNYTMVESFVRGQGQPATKPGDSVSGYVGGFPPAAAHAFAGNWAGPGNGVVRLRIAVSGTSAVVRAFGSCTPTLCNLGATRAIVFGASISSTTGNVLLAPYTFSFKNEQLVIQLVKGKTAKQDQLVVGNYNEFTDGSGRSNYDMTTTFHRI
jgi:hypothetical protein